MSMWKKMGLGEVNDDLFKELLRRAGLADRQITPDAAWSIGTTVATLSYEPKNKPFLLADPTLPEHADDYLAAWPAMRETARWLMVEFAPCHDPRYRDTDTTFGGCYGCKTDNIEDFGRIYSSKLHPYGHIEGIVSSLANWKLYALGLKHHEWTKEFIKHGPEYKHDHPLRPAERVQVGTVIHTMFCFEHIAEWYIYLRKQQGAQAAIVYRLGVAIERVARALPLAHEFKSEATKSGKELLSGMTEWAERLIQQEKR